jgi:hypothetical protein
MNPNQARNQERSEVVGSELVRALWSPDRTAARLPDFVRYPLEAHFGMALDGVRVSTSPLLENLNARAFASGSDVFFAPGAYEPSTENGRRLLCHELAHIIQQRMVAVPQALSDAPAAIVRSPRLEHEADLLAEKALQVLAGRTARTDGNGARPPRWRESCGADTRMIQLQETGVIGGNVFGGPIMDAALAPNTVIFRQTASINEVYANRNDARTRARLRHNLGGKAQRTYYSNAGHAIVGGFGEGKNFRFMRDRTLNPQESYGRYYDFDNGGLLVEHTNDQNCRLIQITAVTAAMVSYRRWIMLPHFHMATYAESSYHHGLGEGLTPDQLQGPPPGYDLAVVTSGHHIYHLSGAPPTVQHHAVGPFTQAFNSGARAVFQLVWNW